MARDDFACGDLRGRGTDLVPPSHTLSIIHGKIIPMLDESEI